MDLDLHSEAVAFVREHNCAAHTSVELVEAAMRAGAELAITHTTARVHDVRQALADRRARNFRG